MNVPLLVSLAPLILVYGCGSSQSTSPKNTRPTGVDDTQVALDQASAELADSAAPPASSGVERDPGAPMGAPNVCDERFSNDRVITPDSDSANRRAPTPEDAIREGLTCYVAMRDTHSSWCCKR
ncbi:MAG: hypothetical protein U0414_35140 [Polyangiaceae bacterium]